MDVVVFFQKSGRWLAIGAAAFGLWAVVQRPGGKPVVSSWGGDAAQQGLGTVANSGGLTGLFAQQQSNTRRTPLALDPHPQEWPWGDPLDSARTVMTQGYGVGSHAPAQSWGAIDLALDGDGDGLADPQGTWDQPVYATMSGEIKLAPNSYPAGNHVWVIGEEYKTGYAHLSRFAVENGALVKRGDVIGYVGSSGLSNGPHLHYHIWHNGVNVNPLEYGGFQ